MPSDSIFLRAQHDKAIKTFCEVRDKLNTPETMQLYRKAFSKPLAFYLNQSVEEAMAALKTETT